MDLQLSKFAITQYTKKFGEEHIDEQMISSMENHQSSYYSVSYGPTALKICHYTVHQKVTDYI